MQDGRRRLRDHTKHIEHGKTQANTFRERVRVEMITAKTLQQNGKCTLKN